MKSKSDFLEKVQVGGSCGVPRGSGGWGEGDGWKEAEEAAVGSRAREPAGRRLERARGSEMQCVNNR